MNVSGISNAGAQGISNAMTPNGMDSVSQSIQKQIMDAQKQLQELSTDDRLSVEEKMKKRQEIQQQITSLNQQLRQHQIEQRKEQQEKVAQKNDNVQTKENKAAEESMKAMISADNALKQADVYQKVAAQKEGQSDILKIEIKLDESRGGNAEKKKEEQAKLEQEAQEVRERQASTLVDVLQDINETQKNTSNDAVTEKEEPIDSVSEEKKEAGYQHIDVVIDDNTPASEKEENESEIDRYI